MIVTEYKTDKVTRVLMLYHQLLSGQQVDKILFAIEHNINERTFDRDIQDVRLFLSEIYSVDEIKFDKKTNSYQLTGQRSKHIDRMNAAVISKLIIESKTLREDEMEGLVDVVMQAVSSRDAEVIKTYLNYDIKRYSSNTKSAVLKFIGDLYAIINEGCDIELEYIKEDETREKVRVAPLRLECKNNEFYLIAAQDYSLDNVIGVPVDKIECFDKLHTVFARRLKEKYYKKEEG